MNRFADSAWMNVNSVRRLLLLIEGRLEATFNERKKIHDELKKNLAKAGQVLKDHLGQWITYVLPLEQEYPEYFV